MFGIQPQRAGAPPGRDRPAGRRPLGHPEHQDPGRSVRRRPEALQAEGDRPGPPGLGTGAAFHRRRRRPRSQASQPPPAHPSQDDSAGPALGPVGSGVRGQGRRRATRGRGMRRAPGTPGPRSTRSSSSAGCSWCWTGPRRMRTSRSATCRVSSCSSSSELNAYDILCNDWIVFTPRPCRATARRHRGPTPGRRSRRRRPRAPVSRRRSPGRDDQHGRERGQRPECRRRHRATPTDAEP